MKLFDVLLLTLPTCLLGILLGIGLLWLAPPQQSVTAPTSQTSTPATHTAPAQQHTAATASNWPRTFTDGRGAAVNIAQKPARIVSLAPNVTDILLATGAGSKLVGVPREGDHDKVDPSVARIQVYPQISSEALLDLRADLIFGADITSEAQAARLRALGLPVLILNGKGFDGIIADIRLAGKATGHETQANALATQLAAIGKQVQTEVQAADSASARPQVLLFLSDSLDYAAGQGSYAGDLLQLAGAGNAAASAPQPWPKLSKEFVLSTPAAAIIIAVPSQDADANAQAVHIPAAGESPSITARRPLRSTALRAKLQSNAVWKNLPAVRDNRVYVIEADLLNLPGPRIGEALLHLRAIVGDIQGADVASPTDTASTLPAQPPAAKP